MRTKLGDTLVEVALAIGIFSMVAITIVSVVSASTSGAQSALETTLTREDLDAQAEALRFIHESYVSGSQSEDTTENPYANLWNAITRLAVTESVAKSSGALSFNPTVCSSIYDGAGRVKRTVSNQIPFVINTRKLNDPSKTSEIVMTSGETGSKPIFYEATTYPRIVYGDTSSGVAESIDNENFYAQVENNKSTLRRVEGMFIVAVKDSGSKIVSGSSGNIISSSAYYDFYIRSCWMPVGVDHASTISTVVRLYDPAAIEHVDTPTTAKSDYISINYDANSGTPAPIPGWISPQYCSVRMIAKCTVGETNIPTKTDATFIGWSFDKNATTPDLYPGDNIIGTMSAEQFAAKYPERVTLYAVYQQYRITYDYNGSTYKGGSHTEICGTTCTITSITPARTGYEFLGWSTAPNGSPTFTAGSKFSPSKNERFYAIWKASNETLKVVLTFPSGDCDSHVTGYKSNGTQFHAYYGSKIGSDVNGFVLAQLDKDDTHGTRETFTINTLGGRDFYYYVRNYSGCNLSQAVVTLSGTRTGTTTFRYDSRYVSGNDWHVFAIKDGEIRTGW